MKVTFIPDEHIGVVFKASIAATFGLNTVRSRKVSLNMMAKALRSFKLIDNAEVTFIAQGSNSAGRLGVFVGQGVMGATGFTTYGGDQDGQTGA